MRATVGPVPTSYRIFVLLHLLCVIGGFGALAYNGVYLTLARRQRSGVAQAHVLGVNRSVSTLAELLVYGVVLFGIAAVGSSKSVYGFDDAWVIAALALYVVDLGILHGWIRRHQRRYDAVSAALVAATSPPEATSTAQPLEIAELGRLERRIGAGWGVFNIVVVVVVYLMVFKPGR